MSFSNRIRLPFFITRPQFPDETNVFRRADGSTKVLSVIIRKVYEGETDYLPEAIHERLKVALKHDNVTIEGFRYLSGIGVVADGDYEISWITNMLDYPIAKAAFKVEVTPYNNSNDNCQTCAEAMQLELVDDTIPGELEEGSTTEHNVFSNDSICCKPFTASITTINSLYVESAEIDEAGVVTIVLHSTTPSATNANLLTYRVTCPNGSYDEADVFGTINGTEESCEAPGSLDAGTVTETEATPNWFDLPTPLPVSYDYNLYDSDDLFTPIHSGNTTDTSVNFNDLIAGKCYTFFVRSVCESGVSEFISIQFCTPADSEICGRFLVYYNNGSGMPGGEPHIFSYVNCSLDQQNDFIVNMQSKLICAAVDPDLNPISIIGITSYSYVEPCA